MSVNPPEIQIPLFLAAPGAFPRAPDDGIGRGTTILDMHGDGDETTAENRLLAVLDHLAREAASRRARILVRIGGLDGMRIVADLARLTPLRPAGFLLADGRNGADIQKLDVLLKVAEAENRLDIGTAILLAECGGKASFLLSPHSLASRSDRLKGLVFNGARLAGAAPKQGIAEPERSAVRTVARGLCVLKAAEAGLACFETLPYAMTQPDAIRTACATSRADGFSGMVAVNDRQRAVLTTQRDL